MLNLNELSNPYVEYFLVELKQEIDAGIRESQWTINGGFYFQDEEDLEIFKNDVKKLFSNYAGGEIKVYTSDECS